MWRVSVWISQKYLYYIQAKKRHSLIVDIMYIVLFFISGVEEGQLVEGLTEVEEILEEGTLEVECLVEMVVVDYSEVQMAEEMEEEMAEAVEVVGVVEAKKEYNVIFI